MSAHTLSFPVARIHPRHRTVRSTPRRTTPSTGHRSSTAGRQRGLPSRRRMFRLVRTALLACAVLAAAWALALASFTPAAGADAPAPAGDYVTVTVGEGESLWDVARAAAPGADPRPVITEIVEGNELPGTVIHPGQELQVPAR